MRRLIERLLVLTFVVSVLELTGCQYRSKSDIYYLVAPNLKLPYWKSVQEGFKQAAAEYHVDAYVAGPDGYDPAAEADSFSKIVARKPAGILVSVADAGALRNDIASAISAGIPVITVDSDAPFSARLYFIGTNNLEVGHLGGKRLVQRLHGKGNIVVFTIPGQPNMEERWKGYEDILGTSPGIKVVAMSSTRGDSGNAFDQAEQYAHRTGADKIDAFVCLESSSGAAVAEVLARANLKDRIVIAMDVEAETLKAINDGTIDSTISQKPFTMGYLGLKALDDAHHLADHAFKESYTPDLQSVFPAFIDTGSELITKDNVSLLTHPSDAK